MFRKTSSVVACVGLALASVAAAFPRSAEGVENPEQRETTTRDYFESSQEDEAGLRANLRGYADSEGLDIDDVVREESWQSGFSALVDDIRERHPGSFVSAEIMSPASRDGARGWIAFKDRVPTWVGAAAEGSPMPIRLEVKGNYTEAERAKMIADAHEQVLKLPFVETASSQIDPLSGRIDIRFVERAGLQTGQGHRADRVEEGADRALTWVVGAKRLPDVVVSAGEVDDFTEQAYYTGG